MGKRKSEDNPTTANDDLSGSKKRQRVSEEETASKKPKKEKKEKKDKKDKKRTEADATPEEDVVDVAMTEIDNVKTEAPKAEESTEATKTDAAEGEKSKKKRRKNKKAAKEEGDDKPATTEGGETADQNGAEGEAATKSNKKNRFIVFVGNLPYSATVQDIEKHFSAVQPISVRLLHEKANPNKSRGIAFLEFAGFDHMKTCLKTMHHTTLTCQGRDHRGRPKPEERQINVELTAGGGGNTEGRKEKIKAKNEKLNGERERRAIEEEKQKVKKEQERLAKEGEKKSGADGIHPSRRARVPGGRR